jgi:hypothetical protein
MLSLILKGTSMIRLLVCAALLCGWPSLALAQGQYRINVQLTIDNTAAGTPFVASDLAQGNGHPQINSAACISNASGGDFRYRVDGTAPTTTVGVIVPAGGAIIFKDPLSLSAFKAIRTASTNAVLSCTLSSDSEPPVYPVGAGGGSGSGSGCVGTAGTPCVVVGNDAAGSPTAGTVLAVQGIASMTPVTVAPSAGTFATDGTFGSAFPSTGPGIGVRAETTTPTAVTDGQQVAPMATVSGQVFTVPGADANGIGATSGCALVSAASTNATNCKASAGNFYGFRVVNTTATLYYLRMYNLASAPTCSSATGWVESIPIPASTSGAGIVAINLHGENYTTGISYCFTGGASSTDNTNAATGVYGRLFYK